MRKTDADVKTEAEKKSVDKAVRAAEQHMDEHRKVFEELAAR
ncbi:MAG: hypothetical protein R6V07_15345 [Armatimonadota bacterium]